MLLPFGGFTVYVQRFDDSDNHLVWDFELLLEGGMKKTLSLPLSRWI